MEVLTFSTDGGGNCGAWTAEIQANVISQLLFAYFRALCKKEKEVLKALDKGPQSRNAGWSPDPSPGALLFRLWLKTAIQHCPPMPEVRMVLTPEHNACFYYSLNNHLFLWEEALLPADAIIRVWTHLCVWTGQSRCQEKILPLLLDGRRETLTE